MNRPKQWMKRFLLLVWLAGPWTAGAAVGPDHARLVTDVAATVRALAITDETPLSIGPDAAGPFTTALAAALPARVQVDALSVDGPFILFSTDGGFFRGRPGVRR